MWRGRELKRASGCANKRYGLGRFVTALFWVTQRQELVSTGLFLLLFFFFVLCRAFGENRVGLKEVRLNEFSFEYQFCVVAEGIGKDALVTDFECAPTLPLDKEFVVKASLVTAGAFGFEVPVDAEVCTDEAIGRFVGGCGGFVEACKDLVHFEVKHGDLRSVRYNETDHTGDSDYADRGKPFCACHGDSFNSQRVEETSAKRRGGYPRGSILKCCFLSKIARSSRMPSNLWHMFVRLSGFVKRTLAEKSTGWLVSMCYGWAGWQEGVFCLFVRQMKPCAHWIVPLHRGRQASGSGLPSGSRRSVQAVLAGQGDVHVWAQYPRAVQAPSRQRGEVVEQSAEERQSTQRCWVALQRGVVVGQS